MIRKTEYKKKNYKDIQPYQLWKEKFRGKLGHTSVLSLRYGSTCYTLWSSVFMNFHELTDAVTHVARLRETAQISFGPHKNLALL